MKFAVTFEKKTSNTVTKQNSKFRNKSLLLQRGNYINVWSGEACEAITSQEPLTFRLSSNVRADRSNPWKLMMNHIKMEQYSTFLLTIISNWQSHFPSKSIDVIASSFRSGSSPWWLLLKPKNKTKLNQNKLHSLREASIDIKRKSAWKLQF